MKKCPFCAELIQDEAIVCRFCGRDLPPEPQPTTEQRWSTFVSDYKAMEAGQQVRVWAKLSEDGRRYLVENFSIEPVGLRFVQSCHNRTSTGLQVEVLPLPGFETIHSRREKSTSSEIREMNARTHLRCG